MSKRTKLPAARSLPAARLVAVAAHGAETPGATEAERLLQVRQTEFEQAVIEVAFRATPAPWN